MRTSELSTIADGCGLLAVPLVIFAVWIGQWVAWEVFEGVVRVLKSVIEALVRG